jgi:hypothetical protein
VICENGGISDENFTEEYVLQHIGIDFGGSPVLESI